MTYKLLLSTIDDSYTATAPTAEVLYAAVDGGFSCTRLDLEGATWQVTALYLCGSDDFAYLMAVFRYEAQRGTAPILAALPLDAPTAAVVADHLVYFMPGGPTIQSKDGDTYQVQVIYEVVPSTIDPAQDVASIAAFIGIGADPMQLALIPVDASYTTVGPTDEVLRAVLSGPQGFYRQDELGGVYNLTCTYVLSGAEYFYFMAFFRQSADHGATPVKAPVVVEGVAYGLRAVKFVPGTLSIQSKDGDVYQITTQLEVKPASVLPADDLVTINAYVPGV